MIVAVPDRQVRVSTGWRVAVALAALMILAPFLANSVFAATATEARLEGDAAATAFELVLTEGITVEVFTLANPYRVIIDLPDVAFELAPGTGTAGKGLVTAFRYGLFAERKGRIVIDTSGPVKITSAKMVRGGNGKGVVLKVGLEPTNATAFGAGTGAGSDDAASPQGVAKSGTAGPQKKPKAKPVIVIDPGHGGIDPGASGSGQQTEKTIVLSVAHAVKKALQLTGRFDVRMTRANDVFISLDRRLKFSADNDADLFLSIHADSIEEKNLAENIRGATIYTLSERASDEQARQMAEKENASDLIAGLETTRSAGQDQVRNILFDLMKRETSNFSADFSNVLVSRLGKATTMARDPQRSAAFKVLKQSHAPSVLIELGYLSNSHDQQNLADAEWQTKVAAAISSAVQTFFTKRTAEHP